MRKFDSHSIPIRLNLLFSIVILLFMTIIGRFVVYAGFEQGFLRKKASLS